MPLDQVRRVAWNLGSCGRGVSLIDGIEVLFFNHTNARKSSHQNQMKTPIWFEDRINQAGLFVRHTPFRAAKRTFISRASNRRSKSNSHAKND